MIGNSSDARDSLLEALNSTEPTTSTSPVRSVVPAELVSAVGLIVGGIGLCANAGVLAVLYRARKHAGSSVNTLIANQSAIDLYTCVFGMSNIVAYFVHGFKYNGNGIIDGAICTMFQDDVLATLGISERMENVSRKLRKIKTQSFTCQLLIQKYRAQCGFSTAQFVCYLKVGHLWELE